MGCERKDTSLTDQLLEEFVTLWVVIDPIGSIPVFIAMTAGMSVAKRRMVALKSVLVAAGILLFFLAAGQIVIEALGISLEAFQIAGGIILFLFALTMIFGDSKPETEVAEGANKPDVAVFPLAVPSIASPGAMLAVVLLTDNHRFNVEEQAITAGVVLVILLAVFILFLLASPIQKLIGMGGAAIVSRVMGMILGAVAVDAVVEAVTKLITAGAG